jgi:hypothetical protein
MTMINLKYRIPKMLGTTNAAQIAAYSSLVLDQGELSLLMLRITVDAVADMGTYLERNLTLTEVVPDFVNAFGASENPAIWGLESLWGERIQRALNTSLVPN